MARAIPGREPVRDRHPKVGDPWRCSKDRCAATPSSTHAPGGRSRCPRLDWTCPGDPCYLTTRGAMHKTTERPVLGTRFDDGLHLAHEWHRTQVRKGKTTPYVAHLLGVCSLVLEDGGDEDEAIGALLHDAIEDAETVEEARRRAETIRERFGERVLRIVLGLTDGDPEEKE